MKRIVAVIVLFQLLVVNLFGLWQNLYAKANEVIEEKEVTIIDSYTIQTGDSGESSYMTGTDGEEYYKIVGDGYEIGDVIMIYRNANSVNAQVGDTAMGDPEWYSSLKMARQGEIFGITLFSIFTILNVTVLVVYFKKISTGGKKCDCLKGGILPIYIVEQINRKTGTEALMQVGGVGSGHDTYSHHVTSCLHEHGANTDTAVWG